MDSRKVKIGIIVALCFVAITLSIGYAALSAKLSINGTAKVPGDNWSVVFIEEGKTTSHTGKAVCDIGTIDETSITGLLAIFKVPGDSCTFTIPIQNKGTLSASLTEVEGKSDKLEFQGTSADKAILENYVTYEVVYGNTLINNGTLFDEIDTLEPNEKETVTLRVTFTTDAQKLPSSAVTVTGLDRVFIFENRKDVTEEGTPTTGQNGEVLETPITEPDAPVLNGDMIPVYYDNGWKKADASNVDNNWYDYSKQQWANVVTVTESSRSTYKAASKGAIINDEDINTMWVWIPRYSYTIKKELLSTDYYGKATYRDEDNPNPTRELPGEIDVKFITKDTNDNGNAKYTGTNPSGWRTNDAFNFGGEARSGIWVGKFETTGNLSKNRQACIDESCDTTSVTIKPGTTSLRNQTVSSFFYMYRSMQLNNANIYGFITDGDLHMMKNDEWGTVAYLSQSRYGKYGNDAYKGKNKEIYQNKSSGYITGNSNGTTSEGEVLGTQYTYDDMTDLKEGRGQAGPGASTTGTIYGVYDMVGGGYEYVMGVLAYSDLDTIPMSGNTETLNSGFSGKLADGSAYEGIDFFGGENSKYYNMYRSANPIDSNYITVKADQACNGGVCYGHAFSETFGASEGYLGWYGNSSYFPYRTHPWVLRGGNYTYTSATGVIRTGRNSGGALVDSSSRAVFAP